MKNEVYDKLRGLAASIDESNASANNISKTLDSLGKNGGKSKFMIYINGENLTIELPHSLSEIVCKYILKYYHDLIKESQKEMNSIISGLYADTEV